MARLRSPGLSVGDQVAEVGADEVKGAGWWWGGLSGEGFGQIMVAGLELGDLVAEFVDAGSGGGVVHGPGFEGNVVAVDGGFRVVDLGDDGVEFGAAVGVGVVELFLGCGDDAGEKSVGSCIEVGEGWEDGVIGGFGVEAGALAAGEAVLGT